MEHSKENNSNSFLGLDTASFFSESFQRFLDSQKELVHGQIEQLHKIIVTQCKLTGVNPLSQEMAAGALSIKIGKRPRDLLNPKAIKYMQSVFSIKDTVTKKEAREISALCGVTVTQVREFFSGQRSRVRKFVRLSREKAIRLGASKESHDGLLTYPDDAVPLSVQVPENSVELNIVEEGPSCSSQDESIPGIESSDKNFLENIFNLMRKEDTFSGQVKLMEWILQIHNATVLYWFLTKGGMMLLARWLSQAAIEEQTTVLLVIFKVLCHLPLHRALPVQMSAILQTVNRLRFYRTSDISNRARNLLSRWSKLFVRSQALRKPASDVQKERIRKQRISEILRDETWQSKIDIPDEILSLANQSSEGCRKSDPAKTLKLLLESSDDSNKKQIRSVSSPQTRERRKVLLVEQPGGKFPGRKVQVKRSGQANPGRPMSADDIQKAKMRAIYMQSKHQKDGAHGQTRQPENEDRNVLSAPWRGKPLLASQNVRRKLETENRAQPRSETLTEKSTGPKPSMYGNDSFLEKLQGSLIPWRTPPEIRINCLWRVGAGEKSKEVEVQTERIRREKETVYRNPREIPSDPKEPWDVELDFDDSLTLEIPTEQPSEPSSPGTNDEDTTGSSAVVDTIEPPCDSNPEPDLELLAVLLKNPDLVFALTSGQGNSIPSAETVALLDLLKASNIGLAGALNNLAAKLSEKPEPVPVHSQNSQPEPAMKGWHSKSGALPEVMGNPIPRPVLPGNPVLIPSSSTTPSPEKLSAVSLMPDNSLVLPRIPITSQPMHQVLVNRLPAPHQTQVASALPQQHAVTSTLPEMLMVINSEAQETLVTRSLQPQFPATCLGPVASKPLQQIPDTMLPSQQRDTVMRSKHFPVASSRHQHISANSLSLQNFPATSPLVQQAESWNSRQTLVQNSQKSLPATFHSKPSKERSLPPLLPTPARPLPPLISEPPVVRQAWAHPSGSPEIGDLQQISGIGSYRHNAADQATPAIDSGSRPNSLLQDYRVEKETRTGNTPVRNLYFPVNRNNSNAFPATGAVQPPLLPNPDPYLWPPAGDGNEFPSEPELEMWSPERSPELRRGFSSHQNWPRSGRENSNRWRGSRNYNSRPWQHRARNRWRDRRY